MEKQPIPAHAVRQSLPLQALAGAKPANALRRKAGRDQLSRYIRIWAELYGMRDTAPERDIAERSRNGFGRAPIRSSRFE